MAQILARSRATVDPVLRSAVASLPYPVRWTAAYHFGWEDAAGAPSDAASGKAIRPALVLAAAEAVGGEAADAVHAAVAVELAHNFSLVHDDVMDGDRTRRHRATAWAVFGVGEAILVGNALLTLALELLACSGHPSADGQSALLRTAVQALIGGQSADLSFEQRDDVAVAEYLTMAQGKTAALLGASAALGASAGGAGAGTVDHLARFGEQLGLAFQLVDDLLGIWGSEEVTGKPVRSDLRSRKKSMPVVAALAAGDRPGREFARLYALERPLSGPELDRAAQLIEATGARSWTQVQADRLLAGALAQLERAVPSPGARADLTALARMATRRDH